MMRTVIVAGILFILAHFALLIGVTTPEKFYFDEVHYVPAARQMLEPCATRRQAPVRSRGHRTCRWAAA